MVLANQTYKSAQDEPKCRNAQCTDLQVSAKPAYVSQCPKPNVANCSFTLLPFSQAIRVMQVQHKITCSKLLLTLLPFSQAIKYKKSSSKSSVAECSSTPAPLSCAGQCSHAGPAQIAHSDTLHPAAPFFTGHSGPLETKKSSIKSPVAELSAPAHLLRFLLQAIGDKNVQHKITKLSARAHLLSLSHAIKLMQVQHKIAHNRVLQHTCSALFYRPLETK